MYVYIFVNVRVCVFVYEHDFNQIITSHKCIYLRTYVCIFLLGKNIYVSHKQISPVFGDNSLIKKYGILVVIIIIRLVQNQNKILY